MKIIGMAGNDVIAQLTENDIAAIVGSTSFNYDKEARERLLELGLTEKSGYDGHRIVVGATVDLAGRFQRLTDLERKHKELQDVSSKLRAMAALLDRLGDAVIVPPKEQA
jgi:hypothetical protein